jgi:hypothetical protein
MNQLERIYCHIWYPIEGLFTRNKWIRRPFTFIFHDFSHAHPVIYWTLHGVFIGMGIWLISPWIALYCLVCFINGHVVWGGHKYGEQEWPEYDGD